MKYSERKTSQCILPFRNTKYTDTIWRIRDSYFVGHKKKEYPQMPYFRRYKTSSMNITSNQTKYALKKTLKKIIISWTCSFQAVKKRA